MGRDEVGEDPPVAPGRWVLPVVLVVVLATDVAANLLVDGPAATLVVAGGAAVAILAARAGGHDLATLGLGRGALRAGIRLGSAAALVVAVVLVAATSVPPVADAFRSAGAGRSGGAVALTALVRIPLGTALPEELLFRSALLGAARHRGRGVAVAVSSLAFGAWHVLPTLDPRNAVSGDGWVLVGVVAATTAAGAALAWLRLRSDSVVAPALAHAAVNGTALTIAWALARTAPG